MFLRVAHLSSSIRRCATLLRNNEKAPSVLLLLCSNQGFVEIHSPKLLAGASEGGSEVFTTDYFGMEACLAQSPQLYKQMAAACGGFGRVMEVGRAQVLSRIG